MRTIRVLSIVAAFSCSSALAQDACLVERFRLTAPFAQDDSTGASVAIQGGRIVVGSPGSDLGAENAGAAIVLVRDGGVWSQEAVLVANDASEDRYFGGYVDIDGGTIVVGDLAGAIYVFEKSGGVWSQRQRLTTGAQFFFTVFGSGRGLDLEGDTLIANRSPRGAIVFERQGSQWAEQALLIGDDVVDDKGFHGLFVTLDGDTAYVSSPYEKTGPPTGNHFGSVYVFVRDGTTWSQQAKLVPDFMPADYLLFGMNIAAEGDDVLIGAGFNVRCFERTGAAWAETDIIRSDSQHFTFGLSVSRSGNIAAISESGGITCSDRVKVFEKRGSTWFPLRTFLSPDDSGLFACSLALQEETLVVGAPTYSVQPLTISEAFVYSLLLPPENYCEPKASSAGCEAEAGFLGSTTIDGDLLITAREISPSQPGFLLYGYAPGSIPFRGGRLCIQGARRILNAPLPTSGAGGPCGGVVFADFGKRIRSGVDPMLQIGTEVYAQWILRDPGDPTGFGSAFSNGLRFAICP